MGFFTKIGSGYFQVSGLVHVAPFISDTGSLYTCSEDALYTRFFAWLHVQGNRLYSVHRTSK